MKIYLINPRFPLSLWDFSYSRDIGGSQFPFPPLSLATLAGLTPLEHTVVICDENIEPVDLEMDADIVGITGYHIQKARVHQIADAFRSRGIAVAIGGPIVLEQNLRECKEHADAVFQGEAEYTWPAFIRDVAKKTVRPMYIQERLIDLADSPAPRFDLLNLAAYASAIIETSRGCPQSCEFCEIPVRLGKGSRAKSSEQVMAEIRALAGLGADSIFIIDDNFLGNRARAVGLLSEIELFVRSIDYRIYFSCQFTIDTAGDEVMLDLLNRANVRRCFIGIETPRRASLVTARKNQNTVVDPLDAVRRIQSYNITVWGAFIVGFDADDKEIFREQLDFIRAASIPVAMVGILQALPGTPLYDRIRKEGRLRDQNAGGIRGGALQLRRTNIEPLRMTEQELVEGFRTLVNNLYEYDEFGERLLSSVALFNKSKVKGKARFPKKAIPAVIGLLRHYLVTSDFRRTRMFLRVIARTVLANPHCLETVLIHLVVFKHLRMFYEEGTKEKNLNDGSPGGVPLFRLDQS